MTIEQTTILGTVTVLGVVADPPDGWVEVMLPVRPNGSTGWVKADQLSLYVVDGEIVVDLSERRLTYLVDDVEILATEVGIGSKYNQTPTGHYFVTDNVTLANPNSPWGPHALGLSARSETVTEFNGGDGIIGIHGTNNASSIGGNISLGCVRLPNEMITILHELVPLGTRVTVTA
jgi:lipoprotein-anchoring transpeptidase ErfK/SrfK